MVLIATMSGCSSTVEQSDGSEVRFKWLQGELETALAQSLPEVEAAARAALDELRMVRLDGSSSPRKGRLRALMADGTRVQIRLKAAGADHTFIRIKVGTIGDRPVSVQILRHIRRELEQEAAGSRQ